MLNINSLLFFSYTVFISMSLQTLYYPIHYIINFICSIIKQNNINDNLVNLFVYSNIFDSLYFIMNYVLNYKLYYYGDTIEQNDNINLFLCNHVTYLDSLFVPIFIKSFTNIFKKLRFFMDKKYKNLPIVRETIFFNNYYLLEKNIKKDKYIFEKINSEMNNGFNYNTSMCIYPEGRMYFKTSLNDYHKYCNNNNLIPFRKLIHPRYKGIYNIIKSIKNQSIDKIGHLYDITLYYKDVDSKNVTFSDFFNYNINSIHMNVKKINFMDLSNKENEFKQWLYKLYEEKDQLLNNKKDWKLNTSHNKNFVKMLTKFICVNSFIFYFFYLVFTNYYAYYYFLLSVFITFVHYFI